MKIVVDFGITSDAYNHIVKNNSGKRHNVFLVENDKVIHRIAMEKFIENFDPEFGRNSNKTLINVTFITTDDIHIFDNLKAYLFGPVPGMFIEFPIKRGPAMERIDITDPVERPLGVQLLTDFIDDSWVLSMRLVSKQVESV